MKKTRKKLSEMELNNVPEKEFKEVVIKMLKKFDRIEVFRENFNKEKM